MNNHKSHWNSVYETKKDTELGWYEANPTPTLKLIEKTALPKNAVIVNVGAGTTSLIDSLVDKGYTNVIASDISEIALQKLRNRISETFDHDLKIIVDDLTASTEITKLAHIDLWIDRAVLHFFIDEKARENYFKLIRQTVRMNGFVLIAVFSLDGAEKCSGLPLYRYNSEMLSEQLGTNFTLIESFNYTFMNPFGGERPYVYTLFKRIS